MSIQVALARLLVLQKEPIFQHPCMRTHTQHTYTHIHNTHTHTHIYTHTHTQHIHTYTHTHTCSRLHLCSSIWKFMPCPNHILPTHNAIRKEISHSFLNTHQSIPHSLHLNQCKLVMTQQNSRIERLWYLSQSTDHPNKSKLKSTLGCFESILQQQEKS